MKNQTESYILLKPISERVNRIANEITDDEIKYLIKQSIRDQIDRVDFKGALAEIAEVFYEENATEISKIMMNGVISKFK